MAEPIPIAEAPAAVRFSRFFNELARAFMEREGLLHQIALALLAREHVLMTGPPGTAKSAVASAVLGRILDESTGAPSVFSRQFTESTVQTDLVGPVDFKTLMQTGRTEHFTDEGMLGAVHAFLDEVLDGRDMLLRTTLNVLHERELKQGTFTTKGAIECALMTTNRYLAEVLETSRETLLAFIDRIAFIAFVPKSFADHANFAQVLRTQVGGAGRPRLGSLLTIQDLDVLQAAVDDVFVPDEVCDAMGALIEALDRELSSSARSDPSFSPTRYLSTRTAVRLGRVLRAATVLRRITRGGPEEASFDDLSMLRYSLLLCGPPREAVESLLARETDPRERRQLSIMKVEGSIFDAVLARLPKPAPKPVVQVALESVDELARTVERVKKEAVPATLLRTAEKLAKAADAGGREAQRAASLLAETLDALSGGALEQGLAGGAGAMPVDKVVDDLANLAERLEKASGTTRPIARWLRGRAMTLLEEHASLGFAPVGAWLDEGEVTVRPIESSDAMLASLEKLVAEHAKLNAEGAEATAKVEGAPFARAAARLEDQLVVLWDGELQRAVRAALLGKNADQLEAVVGALEPHLEHVDRTGQRLEALGAVPLAFKSRVLGPRIRPLLEAAFERIDARDRLQVIERTSSVLERLEAVGLGRVLTRGELLTLIAHVLLRTERASHPAPSPSAKGYRDLRNAEQRVSLTYTLLVTAFRVSQDAASSRVEYDARLADVHELLEGIPAELRDQVVTMDIERIGRAVTLLEQFWETLRGPIESTCASGDAAALLVVLDDTRKSRFFHVAYDEGAFARFSLEARLVGEVFPAALERTAALRARIDGLESHSSALLARLRRGHADAVWADILATGRP
ncbi:MoxR family ATPase [Pendulispora rubella]|uniref:MoxR family ATPase n=1 Tax=Pendulispora rubella TaxID=2741070 RepID=A0ABZ2KW72_9BACT